jgi:catechol 2,3-dioxygenase-like lactoylglutathione lyase family enzyme
MPDLLGVLETSLYVEEFERACSFYEQVLGLNSIYRDQRLCAYDVGSRGVLLLFLRGRSFETVQLPGGTIPPHDGDGPVHIAFSIAANELAAWEQRLKVEDIAIEGRTKWPRGGESIYFRDPDGHLLELATPGLWPGY